MNYYEDVYRKRLNRYGNNFQDRTQGQREHEFENKLRKSVYRVNFNYEDKIQPATLEPYKQDETRLMQHLLTRVGLELPNGTILMIPDNKGVEQPWMVYWLESMQASGYNRYIVLKMTHFLTWKDLQGQERSSWAYMHGRQDGVLKDMMKGSHETVYNENDIPSFFVMPRTPYIKKDVYLEIGEDEFKEAYRVTGFDIQSTPGVEFVTIDPVLIRNESPDPVPEAGDNDEDYYWLSGGED